jgi:hypothetical protein
MAGMICGMKFAAAIESVSSKLALIKNRRDAAPQKPKGPCLRVVNGSATPVEHVSAAELQAAISSDPDFRNIVDSAI